MKGRCEKVIFPFFLGASGGGCATTPLFIHRGILVGWPSVGSGGEHTRNPWGPRNAEPWSCSLVGFFSEVRDLKVDEESPDPIYYQK
jgi:hypothetical protein